MKCFLRQAVCVCVCVKVPLHKNGQGQINRQLFYAQNHMIGEARARPFQSISVKNTWVEVLAHMVPFLPLSPPPRTDEPFGITTMQKNVQSFNAEVAGLFNRHDFLSVCSIKETKNNFVIVDVHSYAFQIIFTGSEFLIFVLVN